MADLRSKPFTGKGNPDFKDTLTEACICGCASFVIVATFDEGEISGWFTNARCFDCERWWTVPTPLDVP